MYGVNRTAVLAPPSVDLVDPRGRGLTHPTAGPSRPVHGSKFCNTYLVNVKLSLIGTYQAFDSTKFAHPTLAGAQYSSSAYSICAPA